ncbi:MAG: response regulator, partial [Planctomycetota bacterium]
MARILLAEDDEMSRDVVARCLAHAGHDVRCATDGQAVVEMAAADPPDLVIMDLGLPRIDGWAATRLLKDRPGTRDVPVIAVTARAMPEERADAEAAGCDAYDTKPVDIPGLLATVDRLLAAAATARAATDRLAAVRAAGGPPP